jgi:hypothetical protein
MPEPPVRFARTRAVFPLLVLLAILVSLVVNAAHPLTNTDTYFHLRFGEEFLSGHWSLRHPGSVSTFATRPWVPTQWLSEIVMARTEQWFGLSGLAFLSGLLQILLFLAFYRAARDHAGPLVAMPLVAVALFACQAGLSMRPQVASYLLVAVTAAAWMRTRRDGRIRWWLVPLTWVWATVHGMWPIGLIIGVVAVAGLWLDRAPRRTVLRALVVPLASAVAAAVTPVGPALYDAVVAVSTRSSFFVEWDPPDWTQPPNLALAAVLAVTVVTMWKRAHNSWTEILLVGLAAGLAVYSTRTVPLAAALLVPVAAGPLQGLLGRLPSRTSVPGRELVTVAGCSALALVALAVVVPHTATDHPDEPSWLAPSLSTLPPGTKVLDDWGWGGYLMWRFPKLDLMMHGYGDTFTTDELNRNTSLLELDAGWDSVLRATGTRVAVLRPWSRLAYALVSTEGWRVVHASQTWEMLRAPATWDSYGNPVAEPDSAG